ncbi:MULTISPECIES: anthranilate phosphoribosyltransferase [unclassified Bradyrhizobium]|uniref:anthranilate phosphoribosyltransferase n=1 Tax=unclassified Bradyrhizobium TaxID=2631580 RepID=UPI001CD66CB1|nr:MULTISPECIES: anthranilate phosphoribosyltransferase [unclassified Bradyrhizobium]MCA1385588.1 anthranilate phosphoribosyltransferase [Bradyrhizobium sp. BRP05]MCA1394375.1 anthranilate phosphoribosyltransferase [Bradyrhizobium sp. IC3123]MCA1422691.1 anthranilate phosphoribosyltransferase [Bradyrhizobium sp. BRP23]MCA1429130.1 anthranilate phosphoribosyltransferase [Bradyrhizobium sp. NBAIM16]MCA1471026.1 anthranilate phosphoribosyltransferase [Bradyrhizobium sp. IC3195]
MEELRSIIGKVASGATLTREETASAFDSVMSGYATPSQIGGLLMGMRVRGETVEEVTGAASAMRNRMLRVEAACDPVGIAGTNDTPIYSVNVSTCASFIVAGVGIPVAKHANRAASSGSSTADVLARLGVKVDLKPEAIARCVQEANIGFMFASAHYPAMQRVGQIRTALGIHTIFNLIEPLSNPARVKRQIVGVLSPEWVQPLAYVLKNLGAESVWVVHGSDGLDEITLTGPTFVAALEAGIVRTFEVTPEEAGLPRCRDALESGDAEANAVALQNVLDGVPGRFRDAALLNAAAALVVAGRASTLREGVALGQESLDGGAAAARLKRLIAVSNA